MKGTTINKIITSVIAMTIFTPILVLAATTASLSPASANVAVGQKFNIAISVNPQGTNDYAEKLEVNYPADILEATAFTFSGNWIAMTASGYDSIDNTNGSLIKTAGYPGGFSSTTVFGTIYFSAKKAGSGTIRIGNSSLAFQASGQSAITGNEATFSVTSPGVPVQTPAEITQPEVKTTAPNLKPTPAPSVTKPPAKSTTAEATSTTTPTEITGNISPESQTAATASATETGGNIWFRIIAGVAVLIVLIGGAVYLVLKNKR